LINIPINMPYSVRLQGAKLPPPTIHIAKHRLEPVGPLPARSRGIVPIIIPDHTNLIPINKPHEINHEAIFVFVSIYLIAPINNPNNPENIIIRINSRYVNVIITILLLLQIPLQYMQCDYLNNSYQLLLL